MKGEVFIIVTIIMLASIATTPSALGLTGTCTNQTDFSTLVCGGSPDSVTGFGAVEVCGDCYPCGVADGVCPEDFYSTVTRMQASCRLCPDPDCTATLEGYVFEQGLPVPNTDVIAVYNTNNKIGARVKIATSDVNGYYSGTIPAGQHSLFTAYANFQGPTTTKEINRGELAELNFTINRGSCNPDCTIGNTGVCSAICNGVEGCEFPANTTLGFSSDYIAQRCDGLDAQESVAYLGVIGDDTYRFTCCKGPYNNTKTIKVESKPVKTKAFKTSATWKTPTTLADEPVILNIAFGK